QAADHLRLNACELPQQKWRANGNFVLIGQAIFRRTALHDVADVDGLAPKRHRFDQLREKFSRSPDERLTLHIFVVPGPFAYEDQLRFGISDAKYNLGARFVQTAARAFTEIGATRFKRCTR